MHEDDYSVDLHNFAGHRRKHILTKGRIGEASNAGPEDEEEDAEGEETITEVKLQQYNITYLDKNGYATMEATGDVIGVCEHKLTKGQAKKWQKGFLENGRKLIHGPCDGSKKAPCAG